MDSTIKALIAKSWKNESNDLAPGNYFIDEEIVVRVTGTVDKLADEFAAPTVSIPLITTLALFWEKAGITRDNALAMLREALREAMDTRGNKDGCIAGRAAVFFADNWWITTGQTMMIANRQQWFGHLWFLRARLRRLSLKRPHQPTNILLHLDLIEFQRIHLLWLLAHRRQPISFHVTAVIVVIADKFRNEVIQMPLAKDYESRKTFPFYRADATLNVLGRVRSNSSGKWSIIFPDGSEVRT